MGYHRAGFEVVGVDHCFQPNYPFVFFEADALDFMRGLVAGSSVLGWYIEDFHAIHASPPCQRWSKATPLYSREKHPDLIAATRELISATATPYVIENVDGARHLLRNPLMLCGTMFGLRVWRHRWFEAPDIYNILPPCNHTERAVVICGSGHGRGEAKPSEMIAALDVPWMRIRAEARQAIPPAYTEWIGRQLIRRIVEADASLRAVR